MENVRHNIITKLYCGEFRCIISTQISFDLFRPMCIIVIPGIVLYQWHLVWLIIHVANGYYFYKVRLMCLILTHDGLLFHLHIHLHITNPNCKKFRNVPNALHSVIRVHMYIVKATGIYYAHIPLCQYSGTPCTFNWKCMTEISKIRDVLTLVNIYWHLMICCILLCIIAFLKLRNIQLWCIVN